MVHRDIKETFLDKLKTRIIEAYGEDTSKSVDFGRIVSDRHFERVAALIIPEKVVVGGQVDATSRFIAPTVMRDVTLNDAVMTEEIFGPVLPVLDYTEFNEIYDILAQLPQHPLAAYIFSSNKPVYRRVDRAATIRRGLCQPMRSASGQPLPTLRRCGRKRHRRLPRLQRFRRFSHKKGVMKSATWLDLPLMYAPTKTN